MATKTDQQGAHDCLLFDGKEAARRLDISLRMVRTHTLTGLLPCHRVGGLVKYSEA